MTKEEFNKRYDFLLKKRDEAKEELKSRKKWRTALGNEYWLQRTQKYESTKKQVLEMIMTANIMIEHYEKIAKEYDEMVKELQKKFIVK